jgi:hypothetical protein
MGEVVNFPKAKGAKKNDTLDVKQPDPRALGRGAPVLTGKRPSWGVFDDHDGDTPDAA